MFASARFSGALLTQENEILYSRFLVTHMECESRPYAQTGADLRSRCPKAALHRHPSPTPCQGQTTGNFLASSSGHWVYAWYSLTVACRFFNASSCDRLLRTGRVLSFTRVPRSSLATVMKARRLQSLGKSLRM